MSCSANKKKTAEEVNLASSINLTIGLKLFEGGWICSPYHTF
jgi:hypothetical protein